MSYDTNSNKGDVPDIEDMVPVRTFEMGENRGNSPDNINGRLPLNERHRAAINADPDEIVWLRVRALKNGNEVVTKQRIYESGRGLSLEHDEREELDLEPKDEIKYWIAPIENGQEQRNSDTPQKELEITESEGDSSEDDKKEFVWLKDTDGTTYHQVNQNEDTKTVCGIDFSDHNAITTDDPGGFLDECRNCIRKGSEELSNRELINQIGEIAGFDITREDRTNYLTREQLVAIWERLVELEEQIESDK
ncbi:MAG: hypothetical protein ABEH77_00740 [Halobacteriaceae archaeon]